MNSPSFRSLAVLAILALAPCVSAVPTVQTATFTGSHFSMGSITARVNGGADFQPFNESQPLLDVGVTVVVRMTGHAVDTNPWSFPIISDPNLLFASTFLFSGDGPAFNAEAQSYADAPSVLLQPRDARGFTAYTELTYNKRFFSAQDLAYFLNAEPVRITVMSRVQGDIGYGWVDAVAATTVTLTYNVPDCGNSAALLAIGFGMLLVHRRMNRSLPTV